jgi:ArsR family metal-binding transcriptional regulator
MICSTCNQERNENEFRWRNKAKGIKRKQCNICMQKADKKYYDNSEKRKNAVRERSREQLKMKIDFYNDYKSRLKCAKCGESKSYMLDMHHVNTEDKVNEIYIMIQRGYTIEKIKEELEKCIPLCANHHREFHYLENNKGITLDKYLSEE